ncbi:MAG: hypothetical protein ACRCWS_04260 [Propionibacteriaceae bacterium]
MNLEKKYYWSLTRHCVVGEGEEKAENRLGPYTSEKEAAAALQRIQQRNEQWDTDPAFHDPEEEDDLYRFDGSPKRDPETDK